MTASWEESTPSTILLLIIDSFNYELADIYNADEFGLFYKALPGKSLQLKSEKCVGGKHGKVRLEGLAAGNAVGDTLPMFVIGKSKNPGASKELEICHVDIGLKRKVGWTAHFLRNGSVNKIISLNAKAGK